MDCFEYLNHVHRMFWCSSHVRGNSIINGLVFIKSFENNYKYFFIDFSGLWQVLSIFKLLNSAVINMFKVIKIFSCHSSNLDTETEAVYDNDKSYNWKSRIIWFPGMTINQRKWWSAENRGLTLLLVILHGKWTFLWVRYFYFVDKLP